MPRFKSTIAYDGAGFSGWQIQPRGRTVQAEVEAALRKLHKGAEVPVTASGRTDSGVHARGQVIHFDSPLELSPGQWSKAMNSVLPDDVSLLEAESVRSDFHARFDAVSKEYRYFLYIDDVRDPFRRHYAARIGQRLRMEELRKAAAFFPGEHDFTSFCSAKTETENRVRMLEKLEVAEHGDGICLIFKGNGFLYNMVRIITGTLLDVGAGKLAAEAIPDILEAKDRTLAGKTAPAQGLYLWKVTY